MRVVWIIRNKQNNRAEKKDKANADLEVSISSDNMQPEANQEISYTITAKNNGPDKAESIRVINILPSGYSFISASPTKGEWEKDYNEWTMEELEVGKEEKMIMKVKVLEKGDYDMNVLIKSSSITYDRFPANNEIKIGNRVFVMKTTTKNALKLH